MGKQGLRAGGGPAQDHTALARGSEMSSQHTFHTVSGSPLDLGSWMTGPLGTWTLDGE